MLDPIVLRCAIATDIFYRLFAAAGRALFFEARFAPGSFEFIEYIHVALDQRISLLNARRGCAADRRALCST